VIIASTDLYNMRSIQACDFERLIGLIALFRIETTLPKLVITTCNYFTSLSQKQRMLVSTTYLQNVSLNHIKIFDFYRHCCMFHSLRLT